MMDIKSINLRKIFNIRNLFKFAVIVAFLAAMSIGATRAFAQEPDEIEQVNCDWFWKNNWDARGWGHQTESVYGVVVVDENGETSWNRADVSAGDSENAGADARYGTPLCPGATFPAGTVFPPAGPAPRDLSDNTLLAVEYIVNEDGSITIVSVTDTGEHGKPNETGGYTDVTEPAVEPPVTDTQKKGFRCKPTGQDGVYQLNDVSTSADQTGFFVEVDDATLESWALLNGNALNEVQSAYCGALDPNIPAVVTNTLPIIQTAGTDVTTDLVATDITLEDGTLIVSSGDGTVTATNTDGTTNVGTEGQVTLTSGSIVSVPSNGVPATQPDGAVGLGSGSSMDNKAHEDATLVCEANGAGILVCKAVKDK